MHILIWVFLSDMATSKDYNGFLHGVEHAYMKTSFATEKACLDKGLSFV